MVIEVTDAARPRRRSAKLLGLAQTRGGVRAQPVEVDGADAAFESELPDAPKPVVAARNDERVVIAFGRDAAADALGGGEKLGDSETYAAAKSLLGDVEPGFLLSMPAVLQLAEAAGETDADFEKAKPYLEAFGVIAGGNEPRRRDHAVADGGGAEVGSPPRGIGNGGWVGSG